VFPTKEQAGCILQIISKRSEMRTTIITTNLIPSQWGKIFDFVTASAILGREPKMAMMAPFPLPLTSGSCKPRLRPSWTAPVLGLMRMSLNRWVRAVNAEGLKALKSKPIPGQPSRLTPQIAREVEKHLDQSPQDFGLDRARWAGPTLVEHLKRRYGLKLKVRQAQIWMHQLGYRLERASYAYLQALAGEAKRFRQELKKTSKSGTSGNGCLPG
jgi:transposase